MAQLVLIVDDEAMARTLLRLMLVRDGFEVVEAEDGPEALARVKELRPDLILLDVMMPGMDGIAVCKALRGDRDTAELPVILLSAKADFESVDRGLRAGATKYLTKPLSSEKLLRYVHDAVNHIPT